MPATPVISDRDTGAHAAGIKVLGANGVREVLADSAGKFECATGHKVTIDIAETGKIRKRIAGGEIFDVSVLPTATFDELTKHFVAGSVVPVARTSFGMAVRAGGPKPGVRSTDAFKRSLLAAKSIVITDPATGGISGVHFASVLERLGIAQDIKPRLRLSRGSSRHAELVAEGDADMAIQAEHEIRCVPGIDFVPYPAEFQATVTFAAGLGARAKEAAAARTFIEFLSGPAAAAVIRASGMEPG
jgi:molybdate transport system substrate-binding protein